MRFCGVPEARSLSVRWIFFPRASVLASAGEERPPGSIARMAAASTSLWRPPHPSILLAPDIGLDVNRLAVDN